MVIYCLLSSEILLDSAVHNHSKEHGNLIPNEQSFRTQTIIENYASDTKVSFSLTIEFYRILLLKKPNPETIKNPSKQQLNKQKNQPINQTKKYKSKTLKTNKQRNKNTNQISQPNQKNPQHQKENKVLNCCHS